MPMDNTCSCGRCFFVGTDLKFRLSISASGFSQIADDYTITLVQGKKSVVVEKSDIVQGKDGYQYLLVDTTQFDAGVLKMVVTANVNDSDFANGIRREVSVIDLCNIKRI